MDRIIFNGNVGKDCEYSEKDGRGMAKFTVAVNHRVKGEKQTDWRNVTVFGKTAEFCRDYVRKGRTVLVEGRPSAHGYKNKLEEIVGCIDVIAETVDLIGGNRDEAGQNAPVAAPSQPIQVEDDGEMPF